MGSTTNGAALVECVVPLDEEGRRAVRRYWEQVIREEWAEPVRRPPHAVPSDSDARRERREARRAIARIAAASRVAPVVALRSTLAGPAAGSTGEAA